MPVSTSVKTSYFKGNRLVFKPSNTGTAMFNPKALEKGVRIANFAQRFFGKSTAVQIDGKLFHLNTNSLNKYHATLIPSKSGLKFTQSVLFKRVQNTVYQPLENAGKSLKVKTITRLLSTAKASPGDYGTALCDFHKNQELPIRPHSPELAQAVRGLTEPVTEEAAQAIALKKAQDRLEEAGKSLVLAEKNRAKEDAEEAVAYFKTEGLKQAQEFVSFLERNRELIAEKLETSVVNACAKRRLPPDFTEQLVRESKELVSKLLDDARTLRVNTEQAIENIGNIRSTLPEGSSEYDELLNTVSALVKGFATSIDILEPFLASLHSASATANVLYQQITYAYGIYKEAPVKKVFLPPMLKRSITRKAVEKVYENKEDFLKNARRSLTSPPAAPSQWSLSSWVKNGLKAIIFENPETAKEELKRIITKSYADLKAKRAASDPVLVAAKKEFKAAKKDLERKSKASFTTRVARSFTGLRRPRSISQVNLALSQSILDDPWGLPDNGFIDDEERDETPDRVSLGSVDSGHASPDQFSLDSFDFGHASADSISIRSQRNDTVSRESVDSGVNDVDSDDDDFFDALDAESHYKRYVDPFGLDGDEPPRSAAPVADAFGLD